jgi:hypothetical protein
MAEYEIKMTEYTGPNMDIEIEPVHWPWEQEIILVVHDESIFYSNDGKRVFGYKMERCHCGQGEMEGLSM